MALKTLGRGQYKAYRLLGMTHLVATGETPNINDKVDFEQLPFLIYPPMYTFYFISADISLPATKPFKYEEQIFFPKGANSVRIQDVDGFHDVPIAEVVVPDFNVGSALIAGGGNNYCVFSWIGINLLMIAKCDAIVPAVYTKVFGPATEPACQQYVRDHGGITAATN